MRSVVISDHARFEMDRRQIREEDVRKVALSPEQVVSSSMGRVVHQSRITEPSLARAMLLRVVVEERGDTLFVVTAYQTSKVEKYWRPEAEP